MTVGNGNGWPSSIRNAVIAALLGLGAALATFIATSLVTDSNHEQRLDELEGKMKLAREWLQRLDAKP